MSQASYRFYQLLYFYFYRLGENIMEIRASEITRLLEQEIAQLDLPPQLAEVGQVISMVMVSPAFTD
jgi:anaerobic glycerol-3-phosphate dehydrogenase